MLEELHNSLRDNISKFIKTHIFIWVFFYLFFYIFVMVIYIRVFIFVLLISLLYGCGNSSDVETSMLLGKVILIDPGHGGMDDGASYNGVLEDERFKRKSKNY